MNHRSRNGSTAPRVGAGWNTRRAFSLVEVVVVIVIIGVIAAIAIPRISGSVAGADEAALVSNLRTLRAAIDHYAAEHNGVFPGANSDGAGNGANTAGAMVAQLTKFSNASGAVADAADSDHRFGPYLRAIPAAPVGDSKGSDEIEIDLVNPRPVVQVGTAGWVYNPSTGEIIANTDDANRAGTRAYDEY